MDDVYKLQFLSLIARVCKDVTTHIGIKDRDLAEFVIHLALEAESSSAFTKALTDNGAEMQEVFAGKLYQIIIAMTPPSQRKGGVVAENIPAPAKPGLFPGLAIPDSAPIALEVDSRIHSDRQTRIRSNSRERTRRRRSNSRRRNGRRRSRTPPRRYSRSPPRRRSRTPPRRRSRTPTRRRSPRRHRSPPKLLSRRDLIPDQIYKGVVVRLLDFGAIVELTGYERGTSGLVHISQLRRNERVEQVRDVVRPEEKVWVKLLSVDGRRISLSIKDVDQSTGEDLTLSHHNFVENGRRPVEDISKKRQKRLTSPERWELTQLVHANVLDPSELPQFDEESGVNHVSEDLVLEEDVDVELNEHEPAFLQGQTRRSLDLSPIRVVKNPDGTLQRTAMNQVEFAKERREIRRLEKNEANKVDPQAQARAFQDPMSDRRSGQGQMQSVASRDAGVPEWKKASSGKDISIGRKVSTSLAEQRRGLPIYKLRSSLMELIASNQVVVVIGETGSGKSTQMTQYLLEEGYARRGKIGCTQPRRVAAISVAERVAEEFGCRVGEEVGYAIRFQDVTSPATMIKYMTDGMLLRECLMDPDLKGYSVIILDEAHERTIHTDVLFGLLLKCIQRRPDLRLIVTSATLDSMKFSSYFNNCQVFKIPGKLFDVQILYQTEPEPDYLDCALQTVLKIHMTEPAGDVLLFLTGKEEIDTACEILFERMQKLGKRAPPLLVLPVYSVMPSEQQTRIFEPAPDGSRKCVVATNIAEASLTIDGIYYVVDPGFSKVKVYDSKLGMDSLVITPISQASATQRSGRAGRTGPGKCFRLYTEAAFFNEMMPSSVPEIQRTNLGNTVLMLKALGINDLLKFPFMDPPPLQTLLQAMQELYNLGALDDEGLLTRTGRKMAEFPLDPQSSKMLIASVDLGCSDEIVTIVSLLSYAENIFLRPRDKQQAADQARSKFFQPEGDHLTLLEVFKGWQRSGCSSNWCREKYIQSRGMNRVMDVRRQLTTIMDRYRLPQISCGKNYDKVRKAVCAGFFMNACKKDPQEGYRTLAESTPVFIHPSSALFRRKPEFCIYHHLIQTSREYMREVISVDPKWLVELAPRYFTASDPKKLSKRKLQEKIAPLHDRFNEPDSWRLSKRGRG